MGNPYISFIFILVSDCISLLLSFSALVAWPQANIATMATIFDVTFNMFHLRSFYQLLGQVHESFFETSIPPLAITMMISGMLYYTTLLKGAIYFKEFKRTDDDFLAIAGSHAVLGRRTGRVAVPQRLFSPFEVSVGKVRFASKRVLVFLIGVNAEGVGTK